MVSGVLVKQQAASVDRHTLRNPAQSVAMTSRPLASDARRNTAPILRTMEPQTGSFAVARTEGRLTFSEECLGDPR